MDPASATESIEAKEQAAAQAAAQAADKERAKRSWDQQIKRSTRRTRSAGYRRQSPMEKAAGEAARTAARELIKSIFKRR